MSAFQHVLVGLDLDGVNASAILTRAGQLAEPDHIEAVYVCPEHFNYAYYQGGEFINATGLDERVWQDASERLRNLCKRYHIKHHKVLDGNVADAIHDYARGNADLVVVGCHGRHGAQTIFGSHSNAMVHGTPCDVLAVRVADDPAEAPQRYEHVLAAVKLDGESTPVMEHASDIAESCGAILSVCHAYATFDKRQQAAEQRKLQLLAAEYGIPRKRVHNLHGNASRGIHHLADELDVDLVVVGTHGKRGIDLFMGSTANAVMHGAHCDTLSVRVDACSSG